MNPFYWHEGIPEKTGWYLCAWTMGDGAIYDVGKWDGSEWLTFAKGEPNLFHKITPPNEFFKNWKEKLPTDSVLTLKVRLGKNKKHTTLSLFWGLIKIKR